MIVDQIEPSLDEVVIVSYEGEYSTDNGSYHGPGFATLDNGCTYEGKFANGMFHGNGTFSWPQGIKFEGDFCNGSIIGKGTYTWNDGSSYVGEVRDGLRHGAGTFNGSSGQCFVGDWQNGKRHGKGRMTYNDDKVSKYSVSLLMPFLCLSHHIMSLFVFFLIPH
jgi:hypothetical protein